MEEMHSMMKQLISLAEEQLETPARVCTKELGEVIDMIKDLGEAMYYHTITEAMLEGSCEEETKAANIAINTNPVVPTTLS